MLLAMFYLSLMRSLSNALLVVGDAGALVVIRSQAGILDGSAAAVKVGDA